MFSRNTVLLLLALGVSTPTQAFLGHQQPIFARQTLQVQAETAEASNTESSGLEADIRREVCGWNRRNSRTFFGT